MAVTSSEIKFLLSGGVSNRNPNTSLGNYRSDYDIPSAILRNLFDNVSSAEASAGDTEYRGLYIYNSNSTDSVSAFKVYITSSTPSSSSEIDIGLDTVGLGDGRSTGVMIIINNESIPPAGVSFSHPVTYATGLNIGVLGPGQSYGIWLRRTITASAPAADLDEMTIRCEGSV